MMIFALLCLMVLLTWLSNVDGRKSKSARQVTFYASCFKFFLERWQSKNILSVCLTISVPHL